MTDDAEIDATLVAACRPDLLAVTMESFADRLFAHFRVRNLYANIDPALGSEADGDECAAIIRAHYPEAVITRPAAPSFGQAVKTVWGKTGDRPVFHLEDDWVALAEITPDMVMPYLTPDVGMVALSQRPRGPDDNDYVMLPRKVKILGLTVARRQVNGYGTSPRFIAGGLAVRYARLLDPHLDPEKQVHEQRNPKLCRLQERFRCRQVWAPDAGPLIRDLGRDWRISKSIRKAYRKSRVTWVDHEDGKG